MTQRIVSLLFPDKYEEDFSCSELCDDVSIIEQWTDPGKKGIMVAVALLPPTVATGLFAGAGLFENAGYTALLLVVNVVCIILAAQLTFTVLKVKPTMRNWLEEKNAEKAYYQYLSVFSLVMFIAILTIVWIREF
jgi:uncharacterized membrane protein